MKFSTNTRVAAILILILSSGLAGCITTSTFPLRALPGETIALTVGRTADEAGQGVGKDDLIVTITDADGVDHVIDAASTENQGEIREVFRSFPDPLSYAAVNNQPGPSGQVGALIDLPTGLAAGSAKVRWEVLNGKLPSYVFYFWPLGNYSNNIDLEVLSGGPGSPHVFQERSNGVGSISDLEPNPRILFKLGTSRTDIGAVQVQCNMDPAILPGAVGYNIKIVQKYNKIDTNLSYNFVTDPSSTYSNQTLMHLLRTAGGEKGKYRFYAVWADPAATIALTGIEGVTVDPQDPNLGTLDTNHFKAFDMNGNLINDAVMTLKVFY